MTQEAFIPWCACAEAGVFATLCAAGHNEPFYCARGFVVRPRKPTISCNGQPWEET